MSVIDASIVVRALLRLPRSEEATAHIFDATERHAAPDLIGAEILHALRRLERAGAIDADASTDAVERLGELPLARYPTAGLTGRAWSLRHNFTAYDAMYIALAEAVGTRLVTSDERLASAALEHTAIEVVLVG